MYQNNDGRKRRRRGPGQSDDCRPPLIVCVCVCVGSHQRLSIREMRHFTAGRDAGFQSPIRFVCGLGAPEKWKSNNKLRKKKILTKSKWHTTTIRSFEFTSSWDHFSTFFVTLYHPKDGDHLFFCALGDYHVEKIDRSIDWFVNNQSDQWLIGFPDLISLQNHLSKSWPSAGKIDRNGFKEKCERSV